MINKKNISNQSKGILLMIIVSFMVATSQLLWKLSEGNIGLLLITGFILYGVGSLLMIVAFKFGDLSTLHPIMALSYIAALFYSKFILNEPLSLIQLVGILLIIIGVYSLNRKGDNNG